MESPSAIFVLGVTQERQANFFDEGLFSISFHLVRS